MNTGDIYWVNLVPTLGDEIRKTRPVVILNGGHSKYLKLAIVVPITAWNPNWEGNPFFVCLEPSVSNALQKKSAIDCYQLRSLSHQRFLEKLGQIRPAEMDAVKKAVALILDTRMKRDFTPKMALAFPGRAGPLRGPASLINALPALGEARATGPSPLRSQFHI